MKAVVFGGSGFLGSHVADAMTDKGYEVTVYDLSPSRYLRANQKMVVGNILDEDSVSKALKDADIVYNFAGIADIDQAKERPLDTVKINILGNTIILEACRKNNVQRFVFASSLYVYSQAGSFYRSSKQACELIIENYYESYKLPYTILRYGSLYGPRSDDNNWVYQILKQAMTEGKITRYGDGNEIREYIHVSDAARNSVEILSKEYENSYVVITGQQTMRIKDLMIMIKEILGNRINLEFLPASSSLHYEITPYSFNPRISKRIISNHYLDIGQGILECLSEIYKRNYKYKEFEGIYIKEGNGK